MRVLREASAGPTRPRGHGLLRRTAAGITGCCAALPAKVAATAPVADQDSAADLAAQLARQADQLIGYLVAFYVVARFWLAHRVFRQ